MAQIITLLDTAGKPRVFINADRVNKISDRIEATDGITVHLQGDAVRVGGKLEDVIEIINSGTSPDYEVDENGVWVDWEDPRKPKVTPESVFVNQSKVTPAEAVARAGFGADVEVTPAADEPADKPEEKAKPPSSTTALKPVGAAKTAFGKKK